MSLLSDLKLIAVIWEATWVSSTSTLNSGEILLGESWYHEARKTGMSIPPLHILKVSSNPSSVRLTYMTRQAPSEAGKYGSSVLPVMTAIVKHILSLGLLGVFGLAFATQNAIIEFSTITGYFLQDLNTTNSTTFDYVRFITAALNQAYISKIATNFGLINQTYPGIPTCDRNGKPLSQWQQFALELHRLNKESAKNVQYKLLFLGRHGEGYHNAAETFYGTPAWNCYWAELNGNSTNSWEDAAIDPLGVAQAQAAHSLWARLIEQQGIETPDTYFTSPLTRCLQTSNITFSGLNLPRHKPFIPTVKEYLREGISIHTCDRRSNKTYIEQNYPTYKIESNFVEYDYLWNGVTSETSDAQNLRSFAVLESIFSTPQIGSVLSITSHSGEIASILSVVGHIAFPLNTGAVIPALVKVETVEGSPTTTAATWTPSPHCTVPPLSSISNGACVCPNTAAPVTSLLVTESPYVTPSSTFKPTGLP
jgi:broad specificity phosphatase PhoE